MASALAFAAVVSAVGWCFVVRDSWDWGLAEPTGAHGTIAIRHCEEDSRSGWTCWGDFSADTGEFHAGDVRVFVGSDRRPGPVLPARASGPDTAVAWPDGEFQWLFALVLVVGLPFLALWLLHGALDAVDSFGVDLDDEELARTYAEDRRAAAAVADLRRRDRSRRRRRNA